MDSSSNEPSVSKEPKSNERRHYANKKEKIITEQKESLKPNASNVNVPIKAAINEGRRESASKVISGQSNLNHSKSASVETEVPKPKTRRRRYNRGKKEKVNIESKISTNAEKQGEKVASTSTAVNSKTITKNTNETEARPKTMPVTNKSERSQTKKYNGQNGMTDQVPSTSQSVKQKNISNTKPKRQHQYNVKKGLTPYQGNRQVFGTFKCNECSTKWTSDCSYADKFQFCKKCDAKVYPFRQRPLTKKEEEEYLDSIPEPYCHCELIGGPPCKYCMEENPIVLLEWVMKATFKKSTTLDPNSGHQSE